MHSYSGTDLDVRIENSRIYSQVIQRRSLLKHEQKKPMENKPILLGPPRCVPTRELIWIT